MPALAIRGYPRRVVFDWTPADGEHNLWIEKILEQGWEPEFGSAPDGSPIRLGGRDIVRHAVRETEPARIAREAADRVVPRRAAPVAPRPLWEPNLWASEPEGGPPSSTADDH